MGSSEGAYRTALVTGGSSGIGQALAERLAADGALVVLAARRAERLHAVAEGIEAAGGRARVEPMDVTETTAAVARIRALDAELGGFDLVVANAGVGMKHKGLPSYAWEAMAEACHLNFCGAAATLTAVLPQMVERGRGHVVGISSIASFAPIPGRGGYCAPKAGLSMLLECLRLELAGTGVHATAVHPGFVRTAMTAKSEGALPFVMDPPTAAARIVDALPAFPAAIDFPWQLAAAARLGAALPRSVRDRVMGTAAARR
ncbi:MAG: SDR family NAD(P)-dependent oxidoreductase [Deltaproteobacteria bacterium]|nr:SDR family NAD(P)-dependent oxidoreductase [Deltaproteobacteria bacterium]